ncbi:cation transporter [Candidatus Cryosericum hinesii]|jgi:cobalt-zinc-cadmium efflux system protein|uniref:Cation transporter n=1 Tax=Candidatus Cryosericum hinesii TaxID=2290915 RepID=A0A398DQG0_9BACT|nr:cation diffusion facilitator family transporter [Candidatus Cryosericum hinesii]RIE12991.1 cation transporter [Candidatus Cryosericum hinesii]RIE13232.1 cation transporter [Candidatus Cryosericum hinesii]
MSDHNEHELSNGRSLFISILMNLSITVAETVGGLVSGSLALLGDAFHNLTDMLSGILTLWTLRLGRRAHDEKYTFGYRRAEILSAGINAGIMFVIVAGLLYEAYQRFLHPAPINGGIMLSVALIGLAANFTSVLLLHRGAGESLNIRSEYLHLLSDTFSSVGVVIGGVIVTIWHITWVDPLVTVFVAGWVLKEVFEVVREAGGILMEQAPEGLNLAKLDADIRALAHVRDLHHVHVWQLSDAETMFEGHVNVDDISVCDTGPILAQIQELLRDKYGITHATLQFEYESCKGAGLIVNGRD